MKAVGIRELKNRLSAYLREVTAGEVVLVTDRGRVIAELRRPTSEAQLSPAELALQRLVATGSLALACHKTPRPTAHLACGSWRTARRCSTTNGRSGDVLPERGQLVMGVRQV